MAKTKDPGLGSKYQQKITRLINEDGSYNIRRYGGLKGIRDFYKYLIDINWWKFIGLSLIVYLLINAFFAVIYLLIGVEGIQGTSANYSPFLNAYFFSAQTFTTVGYGAMHPVELATNIISLLESFLGLMSIALITGLLYGRFSKPVSKIAFAKHLILTPFEGETALMFKMVNQRNSILLNAKVKSILILDKGDGEEAFNKEYHELMMQTDSVNFFPLTWTLVHLINDRSPLYKLTLEEIKKRNAELIILVEAFDETHSQTVLEKHSFAEDQWLENVKFKRNFKTNGKGEVELYINELNELTSLD